MAFVRSNDIKIGDVCIFELVRKCELRVFILRVGKEVLEKQSGEVASNEATVGCTATAHKSDIFPKKSRKNALKVHSRPITKVEMCDSIGQKREREERAASSDKNCEYVLKKVRGDSSELYSEHINKSLGAGLVISNKEGCQLEEVNTTKKCPEESSSHEKCYSPCPISVIPPQSKPCYQSSGKKDNFQSWGFADRNLFFLKLRGSSIFLKLILLVIYSLSNLLVKIGLGNNSNFKPCCEYKFPL